MTTRTVGKDFLCYLTVNTKLAFKYCSTDLAHCRLKRCQICGRLCYLFWFTIYFYNSLASKLIISSLFYTKSKQMICDYYSNYSVKLQISLSLRVRYSVKHIHLRAKCRALKSPELDLSVIRKQNLLRAHGNSVVLVTE
jgi:hypothetical protein